MAQAAAAPIAKGIGTAAAGSLLPGGKTGSQPTMPSDVQGLRGDLVNFLRNNGQTPNSGGAAPPGSVNQQGGFTPQGPPPSLSNYTAGRNGFNMAQGVSQYANAMQQYRQAGAAPQANPDFSKIFAQPSAPMTAGQSTGVTLGAMPGQVNTQIGAVAPVNGAMGTTMDQATWSALSRDPMFAQLMGRTQQGINAGQAGSTVGMVQSVDQLSAGPESYFAQRVLDPYKQMFGQNRAEALAAAKEASGNLTGSGFSNALGTTVNRSLGEENAALSGVLTDLSKFEVDRQQQVAEREQGRLNTNAGYTTNANIAGAGEISKLMSILSGESIADADNRNRVNMFNTGETNKGTMDFAQRSDNVAMDNARRATELAIQQGRITSEEANNYFNQQVQMIQRQGELDQNNNQFNTAQGNTVGMFNGQQANNTAQSNASNFLQLLSGMAQQGVGPNQTTYTPGMRDAFAQFAPFLMGMFGNQQGAKSNG